MTSVLGIELGSELDEAHEKLDQLCTPGTRPKEEGEDKGDKDARGKERETGEKLENAGVEHVGREPRNKAGEEEEEGHKVLWQLAGTDFSAIYITADDKEHIDSITAFFRPDKQLSYDAVGEVAKAPIKDDKTVLWDVLRVGSPLFRVVAKGANGKVSSIRLFVVKRGSGESARYLGAGVRKSP